MIYSPQPLWYIINRGGGYVVSPVDFSTDCELPYNCDFTLIELDIAISSLREVDVGPDNIHNSMLKHLPPSARVLLLQVFNDLWRHHVFPDTWREAVVMPLLKPNKDGDSPSDYRYISLTSCFCKLLERMVSSRLSWFFERSRLFNPVQCGFRRGHSTVDHLVTRFTHTWKFH